MNFDFGSNWSDDAADVQPGDPQSPIAQPRSNPCHSSTPSTPAPSSTPPPPAANSTPECQTPGLTTPTSRASDDVPASVERSEPAARRARHRRPGVVPPSTKPTLGEIYAEQQGKRDLLVVKMMDSKDKWRILDLADRKKARELATSDISHREKRLGFQTAKRECSQRQHEDKRLKLHHDQAVAEALRQEVSQRESDEKRIRLEHGLATIEAKRAGKALCEAEKTRLNLEHNNQLKMFKETQHHSILTEMLRSSKTTADLQVLMNLLPNSSFSAGSAHPI